MSIIPDHFHDCVSDLFAAWILGVTDRMTGGQGWFYAGKLGTELKIGITKGCPFCRMNHQRLRPLGIAFSEDCKTHETNMKRALGQPSHGAEFFTDCDERFAWLVSKGFVNELSVVEQRVEKNLLKQARGDGGL